MEKIWPLCFFYDEKKFYFYNYFSVNRLIVSARVHDKRKQLALEDVELGNKRINEHSFVFLLVIVGVYT